MLVVGMSATFAWIVTVERVPQMITEWMLAVAKEPWMFLVFTNVLLLIVGMFIESTAAMITFTPILYPIAMKMGIDPVHFGMVIVTNLGVGLVTPPVGACLFVACAIGGTSVDESNQAATALPRRDDGGPVPDYLLARHDSIHPQIFGIQRIGQ